MVLILGGTSACTKPPNKVKPNHKLYIQWSLAMGRAPHKGERLAKKRFLNKLYRVKVGDTMRKHTDGQLLPKYMQYSMVITILETLTGLDDE